jgi:hypothetical protein
MPDKNFTPYAIVPNKKYSDKDIKNDFGYKGQPDLPVEPITALEDAIMLKNSGKGLNFGVPR